LVIASSRWLRLSDTHHSWIHELHFQHKRSQLYLTRWRPICAGTTCPSVQLISDKKLVSSTAVSWPVARSGRYLPANSKLGLIECWPTRRLWPLQQQNRRFQSKIPSKQTPWPLVLKRTIPTDRPPLVDEI
jgi:hypothetical protein